MFDLLETVLIGLVSPPHCVYNFSRKMFLILHFKGTLMQI